MDPNCTVGTWGFFKSTRITERFNIQFRAEFFNIFNQVNFANPNSNRSGGGFGSITRTHPNAGDSRIIQFGLKLLSEGNRASETPAVFVLA